jgi:hypothetical protein
MMTLAQKQLLQRSRSAQDSSFAQSTCARKERREERVRGRHPMEKSIQLCPLYSPIWVGNALSSAQPVPLFDALLLVREFI